MYLKLFLFKNAKCGEEKQQVIKQSVKNLINIFGTIKRAGITEKVNVKM